MTLTNEAYIAELETDKAGLLAKVANYEEEQKLAVTAFKSQEKLLAQKDQQLTEKDHLISDKEEAITKLKVRISELAKLKEVAATTIHRDSENEAEIQKINALTQTEGISPQELETQLLTTRWQNLEERDNYRTKLAHQDQLIRNLRQQIIAYRAKLKTFPPYTNNQEKNAVIIFLLVILTSVLLLK